MSVIIATFVAGILAIVAPKAATAGPDPHPTGRITGGTKVDRGEYDARWRSVVSISSGFDGDAAYEEAFAEDDDDRTFAKDEHICGGTLVAPLLVVTAAHCVTDVEQFRTLHTKYRVRGATRLLNGGAAQPGTRVDVVAVRVHPTWQSNGYFDPFDEPTPQGFDIAILKLAAPIPGAVPMRLVGAADAALWGDGAGLATGARVAGWGVTNALYSAVDIDEADDVQRELREVELPLLTDRRCEATDSPMGRDALLFERASMICGYRGDTDPRLNRSNRRGSCYGDSGGPLMVPDATGAPVLVGVVSWGSTGRGGCNRASVFTRLAAARAWIDESVADIESPQPLSAPTVLDATQLDVNSMRIAWPAGTGAIRRYGVIQEFRARDLSSPMRWGNYEDEEEEETELTPEQLAVIRRLRFISELGSTGAESRSLVVDGIRPARPGQDRQVAFRMQVTSETGRRELGPVLRFNGPIDSRPPGTPGRVWVHSRRNGLVSLRWSPVFDDDCVEGYELQARVAGGSWHRRTSFSGQYCGSDPYGYFDDEEFSSRLPDVEYQHVLYDLAPGRTLFRVVAVDQAGNRALGPARAITTTRRVTRAPNLCRELRSYDDYRRCRERTDGTFGGDDE